ncbi:hypothetical protein Taro_044238 [Colocasia esculenta]|uniref:Uncharacterized protein n=1 Tax=Colocasia esculenta TaxID=4460 RepID=A0A843WN71_COLES|nr:hypothetical protein [Colocasia esculenta]
MDLPLLDFSSSLASSPRPRTPLQELGLLQNVRGITVEIWIPNLTAMSHSMNSPVAFFTRPVATLTRGVVPFCEGRPGGIQGVVPFWTKEDLVVSRVVVFPFRLKEDQLRLGVRIREGDSTLISEILRHCSGTGRRYVRLLSPKVPVG